MDFQLPVGYYNFSPIDFLILKGILILEFPKIIPPLKISGYHMCLQKITTSAPPSQRLHGPRPNHLWPIIGLRRRGRGVRAKAHNPAPIDFVNLD